MFTLSPSTRRRRHLVDRLRQLGVEGEHTVASRPEFRTELRRRLVEAAESEDCCGDGRRLALAGC